jgi:hypothetical protein
MLLFCMENRKLKRIGNPFVNGLAAVAAGSAEVIRNNANKVLLTPVIAGLVAGVGIGFQSTEEIVAEANRKRQAEYEQVIGGLTDRRNEFIDAGASDEIMEVFDAQNPQPEKFAERRIETADRIMMTSIGGFFGTSAGLGLGGLGLAVGALAGGDTHTKKKKRKTQGTSHYNEIEFRR